MKKIRPFIREMKMVAALSSIWKICITKKAALFLPVIFLSFLTSAQNAQILSGKVVNEKNEPLSGASVTIKGKLEGTATSPEGLFTIKAIAASDILIVSFTGYESQQVKIGDQTSINIQLKEAGGVMNEVVVIGYGSAKRKDVTGSVANLSAKDFNKGPVNNPMQQIAGKIAGVVITQPSGDPNQPISIQLRGQTSLTGNQAPLIVVDGVQLPDPGQISSISPSDIVSYDVLKDASATAIYGARGANGVILIGTKKGRSGKAQVDYNGAVGFSKNAKQYDMLTGPEYLAAGGITSNQVTGAPVIKNGNTDWVDAILQTGFTTSHNIGISGGSGNFNYHGALNYLNDKGIIINSGKEMYGINFNAQQKALKSKLVINLGINANRTIRKYTDFGIFRSVLQMPPIATPYDSAGNYYAFRNDAGTTNPVPVQKMKLNNAVEQINLWSGSIDYELIKGLKLGAAGSLFYFNKQSNSYTPALPGAGNINSGSQSSENNNSARGDMHAYYTREFGKHSINAIGVYEYNTFTKSNFGANASDFLYDPIQNNNLGGGNSAVNGVNSGKSTYKLISFLGRVMYNYDARYYLAASLRRDGSSKFGASNQWGYFPSVSAAWRIGNEDFIKDISWINELKLSVGWGRTGNSDAIDPYRTLLLLGSGGRYYNPITPAFAYRDTYSPSQNANPDLKWEIRQGLNFQLDFAVLNNRITGNINLFNDKTIDLLYNYGVPVPPFFVGNIWANVGDLTNKGLEIQLNGDVVKTRDFNWNIGGQISFVKTRVQNLSGSYAGYQIAADHVGAGVIDLPGVNNINATFLQVGYSPYTFFLPHYVGLDEDGKELFDDGKGGAVGVAGINDDIKHYIDPSPKFTYGINSALSYKQLDLNFALRGIYGIKYYNSTRMLIDNVNSGLGNSNTTRRGLASGDKDNRIVSDKWLENGSFLRMDNASLGYTFKNILPDYIDNFRAFVTVANPFVINNYSGLDPEIQVASGGNSYIDRFSADNAYYKTKSYTLGVSISFK